MLHVIQIHFVTLHSLSLFNQVRALRFVVQASVLIDSSVPKSMVREAWRREMFVLGEEEILKPSLG